MADDVFEFWWSAFRESLQTEAERGLDGIYLILHGAMACETIRDVEGELLERLRAIPAARDIPVCGVLDLHGNISRRTFDLSQGLVAYRNNPHTDACEASIRGARLLERIMTTGDVPVSLWRQPAVIWPPTGTATDDDPMKTLEAMAREIEGRFAEIAAVNVFAGFSFADTPSTGVSFSAVTFGAADAVAGALERLSDWALQNREQGNVVDPPLEEVLPEILRKASAGEGPIAIVEPADNIGGGAPGDATTILRVLMDADVPNSAVIINDPAAAAQCQRANIGESVRLSLGGKGNRLTDGPVDLQAVVLSTSDGRFELEDPNSHLASMCGMHIDMGPCAVVKHGGLRILITSRKTPPFDLGQLRSQGIEPETLSVVGVKAAVAHRRAYDRITRSSYTVSTPGPCSSDLRTFPWQHVRRPVFPLDNDVCV
ncbi:MAG: M81 family metallopeptidase [Planctomycetes bacterium]|nr:M81 family metallopeptidase [Planctomycetota bacterium]